jgi:molybdenum cofactor cytidylyltransferase
MLPAIVLAAGRSRRMGTQKLLLPFHGKPMIAHAVDALLHSPVDRVVVVLGHDAQAVIRALGDRDVQFVINDDPTGEMLTSVRCGLAALPAEATAVIVALGDQPQLQPETVRRLIRRFQLGKCSMVVPTFGGQRGHPMLLSTQHCAEIAESFAGQGLRGLLRAHPDEVAEVSIETATILEDIDRPEDYRRALDADGSPKQA